MMSRFFGSAEEYFSCDHYADGDCLITDVNMPSVSGLDLQNRLVTEECRMPIIFMSGNCTDELRAAATETGVIAVLDKPIDVDALIECLHRALKSSLLD